MARPNDQGAPGGVSDRSSEGMTTRLHVVVAAADAPPPRSDTVVLVLDPAWVPHAKERPDLRAARTLLGEVVEVDVVDGALELLDGWAEAAQLADRLLVEGTTYWFRVRETMWRWLHERLVWLNAFEALGVERLEEVVVPPDEDAIADVAAALGATVERPAPPAAPRLRGQRCRIRDRVSRCGPPATDGNVRGAQTGGRIASPAGEVADGGCGRPANHERATARRARRTSGRRSWADRPSACSS